MVTREWRGALFFFVFDALAFAIELAKIEIDVMLGHPVDRRCYGTGREKLKLFGAQTAFHPPSSAASTRPLARKRRKRSAVVFGLELVAAARAAGPIGVSFRRSRIQASAVRAAAIRFA
jgi:hypothetical protein